MSNGGLSKRRAVSGVATMEENVTEIGPVRAEPKEIDGDPRLGSPLTDSSPTPAVIKLRDWISIGQNPG
jgi:hypothetical protein